MKPYQETRNAESAFMEHRPALSFRELKAGPPRNAWRESELQPQKSNSTREEEKGDITRVAELGPNSLQGPGLRNCRDGHRGGEPFP